MLLEPPLIEKPRGKEVALLLEESKAYITWGLCKSLPLLWHRPNGQSKSDREKKSPIEASLPQLTQRINRTSSHLGYASPPPQSLTHAKQILCHWAIVPFLWYMSCARLKVICWFEWLQHPVPMWYVLALSMVPIRQRAASFSLLPIRQTTGFIARVFITKPFFYIALYRKS